MAQQDGINWGRVAQNFLSPGGIILIILLVIFVKCAGPLDGLSKTAEDFKKDPISALRGQTAEQQTQSGIGPTQFCLGGVGCLENPFAGPSLTFTVNPKKVEFLGQAKLSWSSTKTARCIAEGDWGGDKDAAGEENVGNLWRGQSYSLQCESADGKSKTEKIRVSVDVARPFETVPTPKPVSVTGNAASPAGAATPSIGATPGVAPTNAPTPTRTPTPLPLSTRTLSGGFPANGGLADDGKTPCWRGTIELKTMAVFSDHVEVTAWLKITKFNCERSSPLGASLQVGPNSYLDQKEGSGVGPWSKEIRDGGKVVTWTFSGTAPNPNAVKICPTNWPWANGTKDCQEIK